MMFQYRSSTLFLVIVCCCYNSITVIGVSKSSYTSSLYKQHSNNNRNNTRYLQSNSTNMCVYDANGLQLAIASVPVGSNITTSIRICQPIIYTANITSWTTYLPTSDFYAFDISGKNIDLSCNVTSTTTTATVPQCTIDGIGTNNGLFVGSKTNITVSGITFRNGGGNRSTFEHTNGGAFYLFNQSTLIVRSLSVFEENTAFYGGAIMVDMSSTLILQDVNATTTNNTVVTNDVTESFVLTNSTIIFRYNQAWGGGAIHGIAGSTIVSTNGSVLFTNNTALRYGGAVFVGCNSYATFTNDGFYNNRCHTDGGVFAIISKTNLYVTGSYLDSNTAGHKDAEIYQGLNCNTIIKKTKFKKNNVTNDHDADFDENGKKIKVKEKKPKS